MIHLSFPRFSLFCLLLATAHTRGRQQSRHRPPPPCLSPLLSRVLLLILPFWRVDDLLHHHAISPVVVVVLSRLPAGKSSCVVQVTESQLLQGQDWPFVVEASRLRLQLAHLASAVELSPVPSRITCATDTHTHTHFLFRHHSSTFPPCLTGWHASTTKLLKVHPYTAGDDDRPTNGVASTNHLVLSASNLFQFTTTPPSALQRHP